MLAALCLMAWGFNLISMAYWCCLVVQWSKRNVPQDRGHLDEVPGHVAQSVTCLATDACLTADPGVAIRSRPGPILSWRLIMK